MNRIIILFYMDSISNYFKISCMIHTFPNFLCKIIHKMHKKSLINTKVYFKFYNVDITMTRRNNHILKFKIVYTKITY